MQLTEQFGTGTATQTVDNGITGAAREELLRSRPRKTPAFLSSLPQASSEYVSFKSTWACQAVASAQI